MYLLLLNGATKPPYINCKQNANQRVASNHDVRQEASVKRPQVAKSVTQLKFLVFAFVLKEEYVLALINICA